MEKRGIRILAQSKIHKRNKYYCISDNILPNETFFSQFHAKTRSGLFHSLIASVYFLNIPSVQKRAA